MPNITENKIMRPQIIKVLIADIVHCKNYPFKNCSLQNFTLCKQLTTYTKLLFYKRILELI